MKWSLILVVVLMVSQKTTAKHTVYFFPGQGSDSALFSKLALPDSFDHVHISYPIPNKKESLSQFAQRFVNQIDTTENYSFIGVSMGGMICVELAEMLKPKHVIIISSAKHRNELPQGYRMQKIIPINALIPAKLYRRGALFVQPIFEPDRDKEEDTFKRMLSEKDPIYLKRSVDMIINWQRTECVSQIVHIHGNKDHTIPYRNVKGAILVDGGSHMMTLTQADKISKIIIEVLVADEITDLDSE